VSRLRQYKWVEVLESGGNLTPFELYAMMRKSDVVLITSTHEAGPLSVMEGLASGVPVMIGRGVGLQQDFAAHPGVIAYEPNDFDDLVLQLRGLYIRRENYALSVAQWNENYWVEEHKKLFERVYNGQYQTSNA
jgi:glycosyltransferase involved in cell wall biosynthesis